MTRLAPATALLFAATFGAALLAPADAGGLQRPNFDLGPFSSPSLIASRVTLTKAGSSAATEAQAAAAAVVSPTADLAKKQIAAARAKKLAATAAKASEGVVALGVGRDFDELDQIHTLLNDILTGLAAQDTSDDSLLAAKQNNQTVAVANAAAANATVENAISTLATVSDSLVAAESELVQAQTDEVHSIGAGETETSFVQAMQTALTSLQAVEPGVVALQVSQMASKLKDKGVLSSDPTALLGRSYTEQVTTISSGLNALTNKIAEHNTVAAANTAAKRQTRDETQAAKTAASEAKVIAEAMRDNAIAQQWAATADLASAEVMVANSKATTQGLRTDVGTIQTALAEFANVSGIIALQVGDSSGRFEDAKNQIEFLLLAMENALDTEEINEIMDKNSKYTAYTSSGTLLNTKTGIYDAKQATLNAKDADIAVALANKNSAIADFDDEVASQDREETVLTDLEAVLSGLTTNLATAVGTVKGPIAGGSQALLGESVVNLQMQAERSHSDFATQFGTLISTLRADMLTVKATKQADVDAKTTIHDDEVTSRVPIKAERDAAYDAKVAQEADRAAKLALYNTASAKMTNNMAIRDQEKTTISNVRTILSSIV